MEFKVFENKQKRLRWVAVVWALLLLAYGVSYFFFDGLISIATLIGGLLGALPVFGNTYKKVTLTEAELVLHRYLARPQHIPYEEIYRLKRNPYSDQPELDIYYEKHHQLSLRSRQLADLEAALRRHVYSPAEERTG
jgi:hypothetical protein